MVELSAKSRTELGKKVQALREQGFLPAVVYGGKDGTQSITLSARDFLKVWKSTGESTLLDLSIEGSGKKSVLIHDVAVHPVTNQPVHVDFYEARADHKIRVYVPLAFTGESDAVKSLGGVLVKVAHELEVEALPKDLPHEITIDISAITSFDDVIAVSDLKLPAGVSIEAEDEMVLVKVEAPRSDDELASLNEQVEVNLENIETVQKGKKESEEEVVEE